MPSISQRLIAIPKYGLFKLKGWILEYIDIMIFPVVTLLSSLSQLRKGKSLIIQHAIKQIYYTGVRGIFAITILGIVIGLVVGLVVGLLEDATMGFINFFQQGWQSLFMILMVLKLFGPLLVMLIIVAKTGSAVTIEVGYMKVNHELEAMDMMGIDVLHFVVFPRIIGIAIAMMALFIYFILISTIANLAYFALIEGVWWMDFIQTFWEAMRIQDLVYDMLYMAGFGMIIAGVSCYHGMSVRLSFTEIPSINTKAIIRSLILCLLYYGLITYFAIEAGGWFEFTI
jgi:phospholipid/cholesterol/gamma-HCH transport system permease protein